MRASASARSGGGLNENFTVRKISYGEGVERVFPLYSPMIDSIKVVRRGKVRRAKLYYLRGLRGKSARITEEQDHTASAAEPAAAVRGGNCALSLIALVCLCRHFWRASRSRSIWSPLRRARSATGRRRRDRDDCRIRRALPVLQAAPVELLRQLPACRTCRAGRWPHAVHREPLSACRWNPVPIIGGTRCQISGQSDADDRAGQGSPQRGCHPAPAKIDASTVAPKLRCGRAGWRCTTMPIAACGSTPVLAAMPCRLSLAVWTDLKKAPLTSRVTGSSAWQSRARSTTRSGTTTWSTSSRTAPACSTSTGISCMR